MAFCELKPGSSCAATARFIVSDELKFPCGVCHQRQNFTHTVYFLFELAYFGTNCGTSGIYRMNAATVVVPEPCISDNNKIRNFCGSGRRLFGTIPVKAAAPVDDANKVRSSAASQRCIWAGEYATTFIMALTRPSACHK